MRPAIRRLAAPIVLAIAAIVVALAIYVARRPPLARKEGTLTAGGPIPVAPRRAAYVTNNGSDSLSVLDRDGESVTTVAIDLEPDEHEGPHHLAIDTEARSVFVALAFPPSRGGRKRKAHESHGSAADVGKVVRLRLDDLAATDVADVDENPGDLVLTHDRSRVLVTHFDLRRAMIVAARGAASPATMFADLLVLDARTLTRIGRRAVCTAPHGVVTTRDDRTAFVACYGSDELAVVDLSEPGFRAARFPLGAAPGVPGIPRYGPYSATLSPDESSVVVASLESQDIRVFDRAAKHFVARLTVSLSAKAFMPAFVGRHLLVPTQAPDGLVLVDVDAGAIERRVPLAASDCVRPHVVGIADDGRVYLVCEGEPSRTGTVLELDRESFAVVRRWTVGLAPDGIAFGR